MPRSTLHPGVHAPPMAGGQPISEATADAAAEWLTLLMSGEALDADRARWQQWRDAHAEHERAWRHIETVTGRLKLMHADAAWQALSTHTAQDAPTQAGRRKALKLLLWGGTAGTVGVLASRSDTWQLAQATHRTRTGERRQFALDDGTVVLLNTRSAIRVDFSAQGRVLRLLAGEVLVTTGHQTRGGAPEPRPFIVETSEGRIRALGTRFTVRQWPDRTSVAVLESAVEVSPWDAMVRPRVLTAGQQQSFTRGTLETPTSIGEQTSAWTLGQIVADNMRLADFVAELERHRPGWIRCAPQVADLRLSGVFPLKDTDRILAALPSVLPVTVSTRTPYWVLVEAAL